MSLIEFTKKGIYCKRGDFYIDPWWPVDYAVTTHGHSDHVRRAGLQVPASIAQNDLIRLESILAKYNPGILLINGDMFHHDLNTDIDEFFLWRKRYKELHIILVKGNHDKLLSTDYQNFDIEIHEPNFCISRFCFIHDETKCNEAELYPICGHVHPGVSIIGKAKQRLKFPCFYFGLKHAVMPAFSSFTGTYKVIKKAGDRIIAITSNDLIEV